MDFITFKKKIGAKIRDLRLEKGMTQEDLENGVDGIPYRTIQNIEGGKSNPNLRTLYKLGKQFEIRPKYLLDVEETKSRKKHKVTDEEFSSLYRYFVNANLMKKRLEESIIYSPINRTQDQLLEIQLYMELWFAFLMVVIEGAIFELEIKESPFDNLYDFEKNRWKNDYILKLKISQNLIRTYHSDYSPNVTKDLDEISTLLVFVKSLHNSIYEYFQKEPKYKKSLESNARMSLNF